MPEITVTLITLCIGLALLMAACKLAGWVFHVLFRGLQAILDIGTMDADEAGPNADAIEIIHGDVVDARNWHSKGGTFYSEFWVRDQEQRERRYKLVGIHPELRRGHKVKLLEYAGTLAVVKNHSTGRELCVAPEWLLSPLYPTHRMRKLVISLILLAGFYIMASPSGVTGSGALLIFMVITGALLAIIVFLKHLFTYSSRSSKRRQEFSSFCQEAFDSASHQRRKNYGG